MSNDEVLEMDRLYDNQDDVFNPFPDNQTVHRKQVGHRHRSKTMHRSTKRMITENMPSRRSIGSMTDLYKRSLVTFNNVNREHSASSIGDASHPEVDGALLSTQTCNILHELEQDESLMQNNPQSEQLRMQTIRDMTESLTTKRSIKLRLTRSVKANQHPISYRKRLRYRLDMAFSKFKTSIYNMTSYFELWYNSLKEIHGHYGSGVATYFYFLRWLFIMNCCVTIFTFLFIVLPQIVYVNHGIMSNNTVTNNMIGSLQNVTETIDIEGNVTEMIENIERNSNETFTFISLLTGEGYLTNTLLYYGYYTSETISTDRKAKYSMPNAYFFTMFCTYFFMLAVLSVSTARSYRKNFIETDGRITKAYANKVFCSWDYGIATDKAAKLKCKSIYIEIKELLNDESTSDNGSSKKQIIKLSIQISLNVLVVCLLYASAYTIWYLLSQHDHFSSIIDNSNIHKQRSFTLLNAFVVSSMMLLFPFMFSKMAIFEGYRNPRTALYVVLLRTFFLEITIVAVLVAYWRKSPTECWETSLGQEVYRLVLMDFFFSVVFVLFVNFFRHIFYMTFCKKNGTPEFNIALNTLNLIYNQTLFWVGLFFSPILPIVIIIKMIIIFYFNRFTVMHFCQPPQRSWRAVQTHSIFLGLSFISLLGIICTYGYIITHVQVSKCGPFGKYEYIYQMVIEGAFRLEENHFFFKLLMVLPKPGVIAGIIIAMCAGVYYLRAKSQAQISMVEILRELLVIESKDKEFLVKHLAELEKHKYDEDLVGVDHSNKHFEISATWEYLKEQEDSPIPQRSNKLGNHYNKLLNRNESAKSSTEDLLRYEREHAAEIVRRSAMPSTSNSIHYNQSPKKRA